MKLGELLDKVRESYVSRLAAAIAASPGAAPEPAMLRADGTVAREGKLDLGLRADLARAVGESHETVRVASIALARFEPLRFEWNGVPIELAPFFWDALWMTLVGVPTVVSFDPLREWYERWFEDEEHPTDEGALAHVVHSLSDPRPTREGCEFELDLGSAPVEAFEELLDAAPALGPLRVVFEARRARS